MLLSTESGCKVGWEIYDNREEAEARVPAVVADAQRKLEQGYDFGYQMPGSIRFAANYFRHGDKEPTFQNVYVLTIP